MDHLRVQTPGGAFSLVGHLHLDRPRPCLLVIGGAFPPKGYLHDNVDAYPGANVIVATLPGMETTWTQTDARQMTRGLEQVAARLFGELPLVVLGVSTGNLLALDLRLPSLFEIVSVEPFLGTAHLSPFIDFARSYLRRHPQDTDKAGFLKDLFGVTTAGVTDRDYGYLAAAIRAPTTVLVGKRTLDSPRQGAAWPSLTSIADRVALAANPHVTLEVSLPYGHNPGEDGNEIIRQRVLAALLRASKLCVS